jgi:hypothetical protein
MSKMALKATAQKGAISFSTICKPEAYEPSEPKAHAPQAQAQKLSPACRLVR